MENEQEIAVALAKQGSANQTIRQWLEGPKFKAAVQSLLGDAVTADRFVRVGLNAVMKNPKLLQCSQESFFLAMLQCVSLGLEPDGYKAHVIPYKNNKTNKLEAKLIPDYKGVVYLARLSGELSYIHADVVLDVDEFDFSYGTNAFLRHKPNLEKASEKRVAAYSFVRMKDGSEDFRVYSPADIAKVRAASARASESDSPWVKWTSEMWKKSAFKNHSKWLTLGEKVQKALALDDPDSTEGALDLAITIGEGGADSDFAGIVQDGKTALTKKLEGATGRKSRTPDEAEEAMLAAAAGKMRAAARPEPPKPKQEAVPELDDFPEPPDPSIPFEKQPRFYYQGVLYGANDDLTSWHSLGSPGGRKEEGEGS